MMRSLRTRLIVGLVLSLAGLLIAAGIALDGRLRAALVGEVDASLVATARLLQPLVENDRDGIDLDLTEVVRTEGVEQPLVELWRDDGTVVRRSPALNGGDLPRWPQGDDQPHVRAIQLPDGRPGRAVRIHFEVPPDVTEGDESDARTVAAQDVTLAVAMPTEQLTRQLAKVRSVLIICYVAIVLISVPLVAVAVSTVLRPVQRLAKQLDRIGHDNLNDRLPVDHLPSEIEPMVERLNDLLHRLDAAFERERSFTGDVAHELRTPLAAMLSIIEVTTSQQRSDDEYARAIDELRQVLDGMQTMVQKLLALARLDRQVVGSTCDVSLAAAVADAWSPLAATAESRQLTCTLTVADDLACRVDPDLLQIVLSNVLVNAVQYTNRGGSVDLRAEPAGSEVKLMLTNTGCDLAPDRAAHVWERFWRGDVSRTDGGWHSGLGLSLVNRAMRLGGGEATASITADGRFTVTLTFPASPPIGPPSGQ